MPPNPQTAPILVFDIETIPDVATGKRLYPEIASLDDEQALTALIALREQEVNSPFMRQPLHKIACLSFLWVENGNMTLKSLSLENHSEEQILQTFFRAFEKQPTLVSWNGKGFDIPVIMYRALQYDISVPKFFSEMGDMKYNNYLHRYHDRHTDLMVKMSMGATYQPLDTVASLCSFAGKQDIDGTMVVGLVQAENWQTLTTYCEGDVINTWLLYLRWQRLTGKMPVEMAKNWEVATHQYLSGLQNTVVKTSNRDNATADLESGELESGDLENNALKNGEETKTPTLRHAKFLAGWEFGNGEKI